MLPSQLLSVFTPATDCSSPPTGSHTVLGKTMKQSDIRFIRDGVFEFQKGHGDQTPGGDDIVQIQFGGIQTAVTSKQSGEKDDV